MGAGGDETLSRIDEPREPAVVVVSGSGEARGSESSRRSIIRRRLSGSPKRTLPELPACAQSSSRNGVVGLLFPRRLH